MNGYNSKNYREQGGDTMVIGGALKFEDGATVENFPGAVNVPDTSGNASANAAVIKSMLIALKDAGLMEGDAWSLTFKTATGASLHDMPTANTLENSQAVTGVTLEDGVITVALNCKVSALKDCDHGEPWGTHKWLGFGICTGFSSVAGIVFEDSKAPVTLTVADDAEASDLGLSAGDFILYIKAEKVIEGGLAFKLYGVGMEKTTYTLRITEAS